MMSSASEHRAKAEQLLEEAHTTHDQISRSLILAEAQVHATLALSAPAGDGPPSPGQAQTGSTASIGEARPVVPAGGDEFPVLPHVPPRATRRRTRRDDPTRTAPLTVTGKRPEPANRPVRPPAEPAGDTSSSPSAEDLDLGRRRQRNQRQEQEPGPAQEQEPGPEGQSPAAGDPGEQDPGGPTPFR
jgi:hypothetical protein